MSKVEIESLKELEFTKGETHWRVSGGKIRKWEYLCPFPFHNPKNMGTYDIIIWKDLDVPERIYRKDLVEMMEKNSHVTNYEEAKIELIRQAEDNLESIKRIYAP
jgi:hypothetical protein